MSMALGREKENCGNKSFAQLPTMHPDYTKMWNKWPGILLEAFI
jgi:hypothetical protein